MQADHESSAAFASAIRRAYDLLLAGASLDSIASTWNAAGLAADPERLPRTTGRRGEWTADSVRAVLVDPAHGDPGSPAAVVGKDVWEAATRVLAEPAESPGGEPERSLLTAIAVCGTCRRPVHPELASPGQPAYRCDGDGSGVHLTRSAGPVDSWVRLQVIDRLSRPDAPELLADPDRPDLYALRAHSAGLRLRRSQLADAATAGTVDGSVAAAGTERLDAELATVEDHMVDHSRRDVPASSTGADPVDVGWDRLSTARQRGVLLALAEQVELHPIPPGRRPGDPDVLRATVIVTWRVG